MGWGRERGKHCSTSGLKHLTMDPGTSSNPTPPLSSPGGCLAELIPTQYPPPLLLTHLGKTKSTGILLWPVPSSIRLASGSRTLEPGSHVSSGEKPLSCHLHLTEVNRHAILMAPLVLDLTIPRTRYIEFLLVFQTKQRPPLLKGLGLPRRLPTQGLLRWRPSVPFPGEIWQSNREAPTLSLQLPAT